MFYAHFNMVRHYICLNFKISTNIIPPHVKMSIKHDMREFFLKLIMNQLQFRSCRAACDNCYK